MGLLSIPLLIATLVTGIIARLLMKYLSYVPSHNPFTFDARQPVRPKVTDQKKRDAVLKQGFSIEKVPQNLDVIVIGSGIGGLCTAAILSRSGKKVLVLEQHDQAGGCCHTFIDKGYEFDVGIHYIGQMYPNSISKTLLDQITAGQLTWAPLDEEYDEVIFLNKEPPHRHYPVPAGKGCWKEELKKQFPSEVEAIDKFFEYVRDAYKGQRSSMAVKLMPLCLVRFLVLTNLVSYISNYWKWNARTLKEVVWELTSNQELRDIFCYSYGDYGTVPSRAGFPMQALLHSHFAEGAWYPVGGASEIAHGIIPVIEAAGGRVLVRSPVSGIDVNEQGRACGVRVKKGQQDIVISAPVIISAAGVYNTFENLLPHSTASTSMLWPLIKTSQHGVGAMSVFVGLNCPAEELDIPVKRNFWIFSGNDIDKVVVDYMNLSQEEALDADVPLGFVSFPSTKDPEWNNRFPGKTTLALVTLAPYRWFEEWEKEPCTRRSDDYKSVKKTIGHKLIHLATRVFPSIEEHIDYVDIGSPLSNNFYLGSPKGEIYGLDHCQERFSAWRSALLRPKTDIPGLYLSGQDICSAGMTGALWGGFLSAAAVLQRSLHKDLAHLHKKIMASEKDKKD